VKSSVPYFRVRSAVSSITGAIQSTRYRAIFDGCPYHIRFSGTGNTFQVAGEAVSGGACATTFTNAGGADPFGSPAVVLNQNVRLQFKPSGFVQATAGTTSKVVRSIGSFAAALFFYGCGFCAGHLQQIAARLRRRTLHKALWES